MAGLAAVFGSGAMNNSVAEIERTNAMFVIGSNTTENHPIIALRMKKAVHNGAKLIIADPRKIPLVKFAHLWLRHKPGTDIALINSMMHVILEEGLEETLTLHRLGLFHQLGISLKTTNCIESVISQVGQYTDKVDYWKNSSQKHRWIAAALLEIEPRLRRTKGYRYLPTLRVALKQRLQLIKRAA